MKRNFDDNIEKKIEKKAGKNKDFFLWVLCMSIFIIVGSSYVIFSNMIIPETCTVSNVTVNKFQHILPWHCKCSECLDLELCEDTQMGICCADPKCKYRGSIYDNERCKIKYGDYYNITAKVKIFEEVKDINVKCASNNEPCKELYKSIPTSSSRTCWYFQRDSSTIFLMKPEESEKPKKVQGILFFGILEFTFISILYFKGKL